MHTEPSLFDRAKHACRQGAFDTALPLADALIAANPQDVDALHLRGQIAQGLGELNDALAWFTRAVEVWPHPVCCDSLCMLQTLLRDYAAAADSARLGLRMIQERFQDFEDSARLWYNLGVALQYGEQLDAAAESYRQAIAHQPDLANAHNNLGIISMDLDDLPRAIVHLKHAVALNPHYLLAHSNLGHTLLAVGRFEEAWPHFEQRWASFETGDRTLSAQAPVLPIARWSGEAVAAHSTLLVLHEQGFGDALHFCRYLPMALSGRFSRVAYVCPKPLRRLFEHSLCARWPNLVLLDDQPADLSAWSHYALLMSLPMCFGTRLETIPAPVPYLFAHAPKEAPASTMPRIGIAWAGGHTGLSADARRSIAPAKLAALFACDGVQWVSLQKAETDAKKLPPQFAHLVIDQMDEVQDFADTAALIATLDLVICVDTAVAHLAAAMGKRVWLLNRFAGCWRWLRGRDDSPWYPGLRLFTQTTRDDWDSVLQDVAAALETEKKARIVGA